MKWIRENIEKIPSLNTFLEQVATIENNVCSNPALCVETCKALIEGICKTILTNKNIQFPNDSSTSWLVQQAINSTLNTDETYRVDIVELGRRIAGISDKLSQIRNNAGFATHGMDVLNPRFSETLSIFAFKITDTIIGFILNCYTNNRVVSKDHRIHYSDCQPFNETFDELNPMQFGLSASLALFEQDYEAYKASYYEYLNDFVPELEGLS